MLNVKTKFGPVSGAQFPVIFQTEEWRDDDGPPGKWGQPGTKGLLLCLSASALASVPTCVLASRTVPLTECYCVSGPFLACTGEVDPEGEVTCHGHLVRGGPRSPVLHPPSSPPFHDSLHQGAFEPHPHPLCSPLWNPHHLPFLSPLFSKVPGSSTGAPPPAAMPVGSLATHRVLAPLPQMCNRCGC